MLALASALSCVGSLNKIYHFVIGTNDLSRFPWRVPTQYIIGTEYVLLCIDSVIVGF